MAVGTDQRQDDTVLCLFLHCPDLLVEASQAAVEVVFAVIDGERVVLVVQLELCLADAIGVSADQGSYVLTLPAVVLQRVKAQDHIHRISVPVQSGTGPRRRK